MQNAELLNISGDGEFVYMNVRSEYAENLRVKIAKIKARNVSKEIWHLPNQIDRILKGLLSRNFSIRF